MTTDHSVDHAKEANEESEAAGAVLLGSASSSRTPPDEAEIKLMEENPLYDPAKGVAISNR